MRETVRATLANDEFLSSLLTGGVHAGQEITRQTHAGAFDADGELRPCALVRLGVETPRGPHPGGSQLSVTIYLYQMGGYEVIDRARERIYDLLSGSQVASGVWTVEHSDDVLDQEDPGLGACLEVSRYTVVRAR